MNYVSVHVMTRQIWHAYTGNMMRMMLSLRMTSRRGWSWHHMSSCPRGQQRGPGRVINTPSRALSGQGGNLLIIFVTARLFLIYFYKNTDELTMLLSCHTWYFLWKVTNISPCRCAQPRAGGAVHPEVAAVLRRLRLHGPRGRPQGEGDQEGDPERGCGLHHGGPRRPHGGRLPGDNSNGQYHATAQ